MAEGLGLLIMTLPLIFLAALFARHLLDHRP